MSNPENLELESEVKIIKKSIKVVNAAKSAIGFNLIPPRPEEEIEIIRERDNTIVYSLILIFVATFVYLILRIIDFTIIDNQIDALNQDITTLDALIRSKDESTVVLGELITKANLLAPTLQSDTSPKEFVDIAQEIAGGNRIQAYTRQNASSFSIVLIIENYNQVETILTAARENEKIQNIFVESIAERILDSGEIEWSLNISFGINRSAS